jgi:hypothetical protein
VLLRQAVTGYEKQGLDSWQRYYAQSLLAASLAMRQEYAEAEPLIVAGYEGMIRLRPSISAESLPKLDEVKRSIVRLYQDWGKPDRASAWETRAR